MITGSDIGDILARVLVIEPGVPEDGQGYGHHQRNYQLSTRREAGGILRDASRSPFYLSTFAI